MSQQLLQLPPAGPKRNLCIAALSLLCAAAIAVAVAVPVTAAARSAAATAAAGAAAATGPARQLAAGTPAVRSSSGSSSSKVVKEAAAKALQLATKPACQGVQGLCQVPVRLVTFPGTHNSNAVKTTFASIAESQKLTFAQQLQAGARLFDLDYAGGRNGPRFGHCMSCLCAFSTDPDENDPAKVFATMASFLASNPREVLILGLSNINCGDKEAARKQLLGLLAASPLVGFLATTALSASTTLGQLVDSNQRAVLLFYDEWTTPTGHNVGSKFVPNQALFRIYGGDTTVDAKDPVAIDAQTAKGLLADVAKQLAAPQPSLTLSTPWRVMGLFPSTCLVCRATDVCGPISCADKANSASFVLYILGKATSRWTRSRGDQSQLVPAFNGFQVDHLQSAPRNNVVAAAKRLNEAAAWMFNTRPNLAPKLGLGNCVWVLDDTAAAGGLACVDQGRLQVQSLLGLGSSSSSRAAAAAAAAGRRLAQQQQQPLAAAAAAGGEDGSGNDMKRRILMPANPALVLRVFADGRVRREIKGMADKAQLLDLSLTAAEVQVLWS